MFGALIPLQPMVWTDDGLICAPRIDPAAATKALASLPLDTEPLDMTFAWPDSPAALVAGWYRRSDRHAPAPAGMDELIQSAGDGFGPRDHPSTAMCLSAMRRLPAAPAVDVGCGSGLLAQAWATLHRQRVHALDVDPAAVTHAQDSLRLTVCADLVTVDRRPITSLHSEELHRHVVVANIPRQAHEELLSRFARPPLAAVLSGLRPHEAPAIVAGYRHLGLRHVQAMRRSRFECHVMVGRT